MPLLSPSAIAETGSTATTDMITSNAIMRSFEYFIYFIPLHL
jgi:hypothetical protein